MQEKDFTNSLPGFWGEQLSVGDELTGSDPWLWHGYLAPGQITLLTAQWKSGKTTLLSILFARLKLGGELAGLKVAPAKPIVLSEETRQQWRPRHRRVDLSHVYFICRPLAGKPSLDQWVDLLKQVAELRRCHGFELLAIDTLSRFLPQGAEANVDASLKALHALERLTSDGMSVLLTHHPSKGRTVAGQASRGSGALCGEVDVLIEMSNCSGAADDRRRRLLAFSRSEETPVQRVIELSEDGADYGVCAAHAADDFSASWHALRLVLEDAPDKLDRRQVHAAWPGDYLRPDESTLWRWLERAVALGLVRRQGSGRKADPFRYWLPYVEEQFRRLNPGYDAGELAEENFRRFLADRDARWLTERREPLAEANAVSATDQTQIEHR